MWLRAEGDCTLGPDSVSMGRSPDSVLGLAIPIDQHLLFNFATVLYHRYDRIVVAPIGRSQLLR
jgi:hypothetical protein